MGVLVEGRWRDEWYETESTGGCFVRRQSAFRDAVSPNRGAACRHGDPTGIVPLGPALDWMPQGTGETGPA